MFHQTIVAEHRFFFALLPPVPLARQLANAAEWFRDTGRAAVADRLHVTLFVLPDQFERPPDLIAQLRCVGDAVAAAPIEISLDYVSAGGRSIALRPQHRSPGLIALHHEIATECRAAAIAERPGYRFQPHVTLGYRDGRPFGQRVAAVGWTAEEFVLIHSHIGRTKYAILGRWPLTTMEDRQLALL